MVFGRVFTRAMTGEALGVVVASVVAIGLLIWYLHQRSMNSLAVELDRDFNHCKTVMCQDLPRHSFVVLYQRFPFETSDMQFIELQRLEDDYSRAVADFLEAYDTRETGLLMAQINRLTELLQALYDKMAAYTHVQSNDMETFQDYSEELYDWFDELRRTHQSNLRYV